MAKLTFSSNKSFGHASGGAKVRKKLLQKMNRCKMCIVLREYEIDLTLRELGVKQKYVLMRSTSVVAIFQMSHFRHKCPLVYSDSFRRRFKYYLPRLDYFAPQNLLTLK